MGHVPVVRLSTVFSGLSFPFQPFQNNGEGPFANRKTAVEQWREKDGGRDSENGKEGTQSEKRGYHLAYLACAYLKTDVAIPTCLGILLCEPQGTHPFPDDRGTTSYETTRYKATVS